MLPPRLTNTCIRSLFLLNTNSIPPNVPLSGCPLSPPSIEYKPTSFTVSIFSVPVVRWSDHALTPSYALGELLGVNSYSVAKNETTSIAVARCPQIIFINNTNQSGGGIRVDYDGVEITTTGNINNITVTLRSVATNSKYVDVANASEVIYTALTYGRSKGF